MDNRIVLAVAGSGKTRLLIERLNIDERFAIITFTNNNERNIKRRIIEKFGCVPSNIHVFTYFSFLYGFCFKPFMLFTTDAKGLTFDPCQNRFAAGLDRFIDKFGRVYSNRLAKFIDSEGFGGLVENRISKYFDVAMIDEVQDFAAHDFNFLTHFVNARSASIFVGDFYQHTFDTSRDGNVNKNLHESFAGYISRVKQLGLLADQETLGKSHRCSPTICEFIKEKLGISIESERTDATEVEFVDNDKLIADIYRDHATVKLFFRDAGKYDCASRNWGASKGENDFVDVCVVLNDETYKHFAGNKLDQLKPQTRNKLYVAMTRARRSVYFMREKQLKTLIGSFSLPTT